VEARQRFQNYYSTTRLRALAERQRGSRHHDRYEALRLVMTLLGSDKGCPELAIPALGGFLFDTKSTTDLNVANLDNQSLLAAVRSLAFITEGNTRRAVDYRNLGPEELGSVYEALLELHPLINTDAGTFELTSAAGNERKTTGSYYTPTSLIKVLLDSALDPVIENAMNESRESRTESGKNGSQIPSLESSLLDLKVCDPACGSGHFLIAAAHRIAGRLAIVRAGGDEPPPNETRRALRDVIRHCIYGVDINPMAVELCKVNLWLESIEPGKPLSFLDAHIKCGNSLVGVGPKTNLDDLEIPDEAFNPVTGDNKASAALLIKRNRQERKGQESLYVTVIDTQNDLDQWLAESIRAMEIMPEDNAAEVESKAEAYHKVNESIEYRKQRQIADLWTAAFFWKIDEPAGRNLEIVAPTQGQLRRLRNGGSTQGGLLDEVKKVNQAEGFFHWPLEFADVDAKGGFECVLGNPPWDMLQLNPQEFFNVSAPEISAIENMADREKAIAQLAQHNPHLYQLYQSAVHEMECTQKFIHVSKRFPLTSFGRINLMALFAELTQHLLNRKGRSGIIIPTGIATDSFNQYFFADLINRSSLVSLFDFENRLAIFPGVHRSYKFCLLVTSGSEIKIADFAFFLSRIEDLHDNRRRFNIHLKDLALFNPNTKTMPIFRSKADAELTLKIYQRIPILENEQTSISTWGFKGILMFMMNTDSKYFKEFPDVNFLPLYEAKMTHQFNHRWATHNGNDVVELSERELDDPLFSIKTKYWVPTNEVNVRLGEWEKKWLLCFRDVTNSTNERTVIASVLPRVGVANNAPVFIPKTQQTNLIACLAGNLNSIAFDFIARQKVGGMHINFFILKQLPVLPPEIYSNADTDFIVPRVLELVYTAYDLTPFAEDLGYHREPFRWDEGRRALLRAELDAYYARLYGLTRDELRYILDPQDVYGPDYPSETFRVLKDKELRQFGEYRTRRLVLEAWDRLEANGEMPDVPGNESIISEQQIASVKASPVQLQPVVVPAPQSKSESQPVEDQSRKEVEPPEGQMTLGDYTLYKCGVCGGMVMAYDRENHIRGKHAGQSVEWRKIK
jgi:hypothetical protein